MKRSIHYLEYIYCHLLIIFLIGRVGFILNNRCVEHLSFLDAIGACWRGFVGHDLMMAAILLAVPWLVGLLALSRPGMKLRVWLAPYYIVMGLIVSTIIVADAVMYEYWQFKLGMVVLSYASSPEGATNSVTLSYILVRAAILLLLILWTVIPCIMLTPKKLPTGRTDRLWFRNISIIWMFLLVSSVCFMHEGDVYGNPRALLANHAAVNPVYAFATSIRLTKNYATRYDYLPEEERADLFQGLYPEPADDIQDSLLTSQRPDILVVFIEGFGSRFVKELGGLPDVAPGWSRLIPQGIFWENYYSIPFGWWHLLKSMYWKYEEALELMIIAVDPEYRNRGVHAMLFNEIIPTILKCGFKYGESNAEMETNNAIQNVWNIYEKEFKRRRRVYAKSI